MMNLVVIGSVVWGLVFPFLHHHLTNHDELTYKELQMTVEDFEALQNPYDALVTAPLWEEFYFRFLPLGVYLNFWELDPSTLWVLNLFQATCFAVLHERSFGSMLFLLLPAGFALGVVFIYFAQLLGPPGLVVGYVVCAIVHAYHNLNVQKYLEFKEKISAQAFACA